MPKKPRRHNIIINKFPLVYLLSTRGTASDWTTKLKMAGPVKKAVMTNTTQDGEMRQSSSNAGSNNTACKTLKVREGTTKKISVPSSSSSCGALDALFLLTHNQGYNQGFASFKIHQDLLNIPMYPTYDECSSSFFLFFWCSSTYEVSEQFTAPAVVKMIAL